MLNYFLEPDRIQVICFALVLVVFVILCIRHLTTMDYGFTPVEEIEKCLKESALGTRISEALEVSESAYSLYLLVSNRNFRDNAPKVYEAIVNGVHGADLNNLVNEYFDNLKDY